MYYFCPVFYGKNSTIPVFFGIAELFAEREGIAASSGAFIVQTDADCVPPEKWLETIAAYLTKNDPDLLIAPVKMESTTPFEAMQALEFLSLVASGAGAAAIGKPVMCNAANLIYKRSLWNETVQEQQDRLVSGDDMFLLLAAKRRKKKIAFLKSPDAIVSTRAADSLSAFLNQRRRWASKSAEYRDFFVIFTAAIVLGIALMTLALLFSGNFGLLAALFFGKLLVDFLFLSEVAPFFGLQKCLKWIVPVAVIYPFYIALSFFSGIFRRKKW